jgi:hypothetical protein
MTIDRHNQTEQQLSKTLTHTQELLKQYLVSLRQELSSRLIERVYEGSSDKPSKWWMCFSKRKFMGMSGVGTFV